MSDTQNDINTLISRLSERQQMEFALRCARRVQHLMRDPRSIAVLEVRERWLRGEVSDKEMEKAAAAALAAARAAALDAAAALAAARAAALAAALDAARAVRAASDAAWDASYAAERKWQRAELGRMLRGGER